MGKIVLLITSIFMLTVVGACADSEDKGAETITFEKGRMPAVVFPHRLHQEKLDNNCNACHDLFPKQKGIIKQMISQGKLKKQQVMNSKCIKCHNERKNEGLAAGPTKCTQCHVRPK